MVKCECCGIESKSSKIYRLSLEDDADEKRVCQGCFGYLMDASKAIRMQSGEIAWEMATTEASSIEICGIETWNVSKFGA